MKAAFYQLERYNQPAKDGEFSSGNCDGKGSVSLFVWHYQAHLGLFDCRQTIKNSGIFECQSRANEQDVLPGTSQSSWLPREVFRITRI